MDERKQGPGEKPFRPCVGLAIFNVRGQVFLGERIDSPGSWQMPQGGIDPGEDIKRAAFRELREETGIENAEIIEIHREKIRYRIPEKLLTEIKPWGGKYAGQEQTWIALRFTGKDREIDIAAHQPPEFQAWQWADFSSVTELAIPFKRQTYQKVIDIFGKYA